MPSYDLNVTTYMLSKFFKPVTSQIRGDLPNPFFLLKSYEINKAFFQAIFDLIEHCLPLLSEGIVVKHEVRKERFIEDSIHITTQNLKYLNGNY